LAEKDENMAGQPSKRSEREANFFNRLAESQSEAWWGHLTPAGRFRDLRRAKMVIRACNLESGQRGLEIGCGGGSFASRYTHYLPAGVHIVAVDIAEMLIAQARARTDLASSADVEFRVANVEHLDFPDSSFDAVFGSSILHHLDLSVALPEAVRVLKRGGRFCFAEPNMANPEVFLTRNVPFLRKISQTSEDETAFFRWQCVRFCRLAQLTDIQVRPFDFLHPRTPKFLLSVVESIGAVLENTPVVREVAGSLLICASKFSPG
jgi:SAM-dependent methyltransferase